MCRGKDFHGSRREPRRVTEIRIAGFGGQGVILAAAVIGKAKAIYQGDFATMTQDFGPPTTSSTVVGWLTLAGLWHRGLFFLTKPSFPFGQYLDDTRSTGTKW